MVPDRLQSRRFEVKYRIDEATARAVREYARGRLEPDEFGLASDVPTYPVHSLYLDSAGLDLFHSTINGDRNRFKLRARFYDDAPNSPVYLEIKRRVDRCIVKQRARVRRECVPDLLSGDLPAWKHLAQADARHYAALLSFCTLRRQLAAGPSAHVAYDREAWTSRENNSVRLTLDRRVQCEVHRTPVLSTAFSRPTGIFAGTVILELKFTNRFPVWFRELVEHLDLQPESAAKYVDGLAAVTAPHLASARWSGPAPSFSFKPGLLPA
ncbi:MAG: polyphosphate polymerase domain-containing protein [Verrucomicrobia bacterium]|nr:polyphosphate polymerase domain-containing protein [Verrucomicrobiota bacterium]